MKYKRKIEMPISVGCELRPLPYPYIDATTLDDVLNGKQVGFVGLLDEGDEVED